MKFLQIKPLCWATANYLTDWPPSGSGYSVEWPCCSPRLPTPSTPPLTTSTTTIARPLSPSPSAKRGHFEKIPQGLILFRRLYISTPLPLPHPSPSTPYPPSSSPQPSIHPKSRERGVCVCVYRGVCLSVTAVIS